MSTRVACSCATRAALLTRIEAIGRTVSAELRNPGPTTPLLVETLSAALGVLVLRNYSALLAAGHPLPTAEGTLDGRGWRACWPSSMRIDRELSLEELARRPVSARPFRPVVQGSTGISPHRYVLQRRLDHAKMLLAAGTLPLAEVALTCGFSSQAHFSSSFKQATGMSPSYFARS